MQNSISEVKQKDLDEATTKVIGELSVTLNGCNYYALDFNEATGEWLEEEFDGSVLDDGRKINTCAVSQLFYSEQMDKAIEVICPESGDAALFRVLELLKASGTITPRSKELIELCFVQGF